MTGSVGQKAKVDHNQDGQPSPLGQPTARVFNIPASKRLDNLIKSISQQYGVSLVPDNQRSLPRCFILHLSNFYLCRVSFRRLLTWTITMKIISFFSLCALMLVSPVHSHGTGVQYCVTAEGKLYICVAHLHGDGVSTSTAGSMTIQQNHLDGQPLITLNPTGSIANISTSSLPGCEGIATRASMCSGRSDNDWVWYDFPTSCNIPVSYTLISGNTDVLAAACPGLIYPATISGTFSDNLAPSIQIDGNDCEGYTQTVSNACGPEAVTFAVTASDDCDASPVMSVEHASGSTFPVGSTSVAVTATDSSGKTSKCTFTVVNVDAAGCLTAMPSGTPTVMPSDMSSNMPSDMPSNMPSNMPSPGLRKGKKASKEKKGSNKTPGSITGKGGF